MNLRRAKSPPLVGEQGGLAVAELANADKATGAASGVAAASGPAATGANGTRRRGNPFAPSSESALFVPRSSDALTNELAAEKGVWIGLAVGLLAWILAFFFPPAALIIAVVGIGLAIWGLSSRRKAFAGAIIVLCVLGFLVAGVQTAKWLYPVIAPLVEPFDAEDESL